MASIALSVIFRLLTNASNVKGVEITRNLSVNAPVDNSYQDIIAHVLRCWFFVLCLSATHAAFGRECRFEYDPVSVPTFYRAEG